jgi:6-phosphogluconolactonase (cycloisomerase 2 family)
MFAYVGCYTTPDRDGRGEGINVYRMDTDSGAWTQVQLVADQPNPSFLAFDSRQQHLYCVHGGDDYSKVSAFSIDAASGELTYRGSQPCGGPNPVGLAVDNTDRFLVVANYGGGSVSVLPLASDGSLIPLSDLVKLTGKPGPDPVQQPGPRPHHVVFDPASRFVMIPDKGLDRVFMFGLDRRGGRLIPTEQASIQAQAGAAPRHAAFHPGRPLAYVINELDSTLTTYRYEPERGALESLQVLSTIPPEFDAKNTTAEIAVAPSGRFVYGSNRGHDSIAIFAVDPDSGTLSSVGWESTQGGNPRNFGLDPSGRFLYAANQNSDTVVTFQVDQESGTLTPTGQVIQTGSPVCIVFGGE